MYFVFKKMLHIITDSICSILSISILQVENLQYESCCVSACSLSLTVAYRQVFVVCEGSDEEASLRYGAPVVQHTDGPHAGPQGPV